MYLRTRQLPTNHRIPDLRKNDTFTQSAIFWKHGLDVEIIENGIFKKFHRIQTQSILIAKTLLLVHIYIAPEVSWSTRAEYWNAMLSLLEEQTEMNPMTKIIITGDLNTRDSRFRVNHEENHA